MHRVDKFCYAQGKTCAFSLYHDLIDDFCFSKWSSRSSSDFAICVATDSDNIHKTRIGLLVAVGRSQGLNKHRRICCTAALESKKMLSPQYSTLSDSMLAIIEWQLICVPFGRMLPH